MHVSMPVFISTYSSPPKAKSQTDTDSQCTMTAAQRLPPASKQVSHNYKPNPFVLESAFYSQEQATRYVQSDADDGNVSRGGDPWFRGLPTSPRFNKWE
jgi:hypothetical protein